MGGTSVVHASLAHFHLTGKLVQLLSTVLQLSMQEHKVSLKTSLDAEAQCTPSVIVKAQMHTREVTEDSGHLVISKCLTMVRRQGRICGDRRRSHFRQDLSTTAAR